MIRGAITSNDRLAVILTIGWEDNVQQVTAIIDTGFTGQLKIPPEKIDDFSLQVTGTEPVQLGDESRIAIRQQANMRALSKLLSTTLQCFY